MDFGTLGRFKRINVVGTSGSGKSTFARELALLLNLPYVEMDRLFWKPNWQETSDEEFFLKIRDATSAESWVLDGNYTRTIPEKWKHVQLVIWLDFSFPRTVFRVTSRVIRRVLTQEELWPGTGNRESLPSAFLSRKSIIWWAIKSYRRNRKKYADVMESPEFGHISFVRLRSPREVTSLLSDLRSLEGKRIQN